jgi:hypothetical protein
MYNAICKHVFEFVMNQDSTLPTLCLLQDVVQLCLVKPHGEIIRDCESMPYVLSKLALKPAVIFDDSPLAGAAELEPFDPSHVVLPDKKSEAYVLLEENLEDLDRFDHTYKFELDVVLLLGFHEIKDYELSSLLEFVPSVNVLQGQVLLEL